MDIVDTNGRAGDEGPAEDYLRYFTDHFTDDEWEIIKRWLLVLVDGLGVRARGVVDGCWNGRFTVGSKGDGV